MSFRSRSYFALDLWDLAMLSQLCVLILVSVAVDGCVTTGNKRHGESCKCSDACLDNSYCLKDDQDGLTCQCLPCQIYSSEFGQCVDLPGVDQACTEQCAPGLTCGTSGTCVDVTMTPGPGEPCTGVCAANLLCLEYPDGVQICADCPPYTEYNPTTMLCEDVPIPQLNEPCTDFCAVNLTCQETRGGRRTCQECPVFHTYDPMIQKCIAPGLNKPCLDTCAPPYTCTNNWEGGPTCQPCPINQYFDMERHHCVDAPKKGEACEGMCTCNLDCMVDPTSGAKTCGCPATSLGYDEKAGICSFDCVQNKTNACWCVPDGDYPACSPLCEDGRYITCYHYQIYVRDCARGSYRHENGTYFLARTVFDPKLRRCEWKTTSCPRALDANWP